MTKRQPTAEWQRIETWARAYFKFPATWTPDSSLAYSHELAGHDLSAITAALRSLAGEWNFMPPIGAIVRELRRQQPDDPLLFGGHDKRTFQAMWRHTLRMYGHAMTVQLLDPYERYVDWRPKGLHSNFTFDGQFARARAHLVELGVMEPVT
ncbi:MAG: hypothetical protein WCO96_01310 [Actinomycetes bacterium]|jgi:hypothetical protein